MWVRRDKGKFGTVMLSQIKAIAVRGPESRMALQSCPKQWAGPLCPCIAAATAKSLQSCPTLCDPIDGSPPGSPVPGAPQY